MHFLPLTLLLGAALAAPLANKEAGPSTLGAATTALPFPDPTGTAPFPFPTGTATGAPFPTGSAGFPHRPHHPHHHHTGTLSGAGPGPTGSVRGRKAHGADAPHKRAPRVTRTRPAGAAGPTGSGRPHHHHHHHTGTGGVVPTGVPTGFPKAGGGKQ